MKKTKKVLFLSFLGIVLVVMCCISLSVNAKSYAYMNIRHSGVDGLYSSSLEYLIDDSKSSTASECMNESYDQFTLYDIMGFTREDLIDEGYQTVYLYFSLDIKEAYNCNGTQTIHLRANSNYLYDLFTPVSISHGGNTSDSEYESYVFLAAIKVNSITDKICLRYSSSGSSNNCAWYNTNLKVSYELSYGELNNGYFTLT